MPGPSWGEDDPADAPLIASNIRALLTDLAAAAAARVTPAVTLAHGWHRRIYAGAGSVPRPNYLGTFRGSPDPDLVDYDVHLADGFGRGVAVTPSAGEVAAHLTDLDRALRQAVSLLDNLIPPGSRPTGAELDGVLWLAAQLHGEWVKIHPYANGNGRTARTWANWVALRYGLPPFVRIKPRPDGLLYPNAALHSMGQPPDWQGNHQQTFSLFVDLLRQQP
jgi:hypothetical protein